MLHLLQPIWLLSAIGIVIPIAIHLWNIKQGKTLKVGSIALLTRTSQEHTRSLRLTELFLLLLRCLLILLLALFLAKPYWQNTGSAKGWVLMEKKDIQQVYTHCKPLVDSLINTGYEFHLFDRDFEKKELQSVVKENNDTARTEFTSYWKLVKQLDNQLPPGLPVYLFTGNRLNRFNGNRPEVSIAVTWQTFTYNDSIRTFISNAYMGVSDSITVITGESDPSATVYRQRAIAVNQPKQKDIVLNITNGSLGVVYRNDAPVSVDTTTWHITVFADENMNDARYVRAALQSIQQVSRRRMELSVASRPGDITGKQDWLFWLSDQSLPVNLPATNILVYEKGNVDPVHSWIQENKHETDGIALYKRVPCLQVNTECLWRDGFGKPILIKESRNEKQLYRFYSHFDPSWNELAWSASFPQLIYGLIDTTLRKEKTDSMDQRVIGETRIQLSAAAKKHTPAKEKADTTNAKRVLWMIIFILFFIERFFSFKQKNEPVNA